MLYIFSSCVYATRKLQKLQSPVGDCNFEAFFKFFSQHIFKPDKLSSPTAGTSRDVPEVPCHTSLGLGVGGRLALNLGAKELRTNFFYSWIWTLTYRRIFFHLFFTKSLHTRYPGVLPLGVKTPKMIFFVLIFFPTDSLS